MWWITSTRQCVLERNIFLSDCVFLWISPAAGSHREKVCQTICFTCRNHLSIFNYHQTVKKSFRFIQKWNLHWHVSPDRIIRDGRWFFQAACCGTPWRREVFPLCSIHSVFTVLPATDPSFKKREREFCVMRWCL